MTNENKNKIEVANMSEQALDGVSHLLNKDNWENLFAERISDITNIQPLSAKFIKDHENDICFALFSAFASSVKNNEEMGKDFTLDFFHRYWRYCLFNGKSGTQVAYAIYNQKSSHIFEKEILDKQSPLDLASLIGATDFSTLPSCKDYEANPYFYDSMQLSAILCLNKEVPLDFLERFVHMVSFADVFTNINLSKKDKESIMDKFGVQIGKTSRYVFPCGTVVSSDFKDIDEGREYYDNVNRYQTEDEAAIREVIKKFPRALLTCDDPQNALAMKAK